MFELLTLFLTGGGSAAMGSILKGVFGAITDARAQKFEMEMAREARNNEQAIKFQEALNGDEQFAGFIEIMNAYSGTNAANLAHYYSGIANLRLGNAEEAIEYLDAFSSNDGNAKPNSARCHR